MGLEMVPDTLGKDAKTKPTVFVYSTNAYQFHVMSGTVLSAGNANTFSDLMEFTI